MQIETAKTKLKNKSAPLPKWKSWICSADQNRWYLFYICWL